MTSLDYLALAIWTLAGINLALLRRRWRRIDDRIERRVQESVLRLREPNLRLARPLTAARAAATDLAALEKHYGSIHPAWITELRRLGAAMRRAS